MNGSATTGPPYTANETRSFGALSGLLVRTTPAYSPESNGMSEAFVKTFKRDDVYFGDVDSAAAVLAALPRWFADYNENHPPQGAQHAVSAAIPPRPSNLNPVSGLTGATPQRFGCCTSRADCSVRASLRASCLMPHHSGRVPINQRARQHAARRYHAVRG
jgi:hypothetical protein